MQYCNGWEHNEVHMGFSLVISTYYVHLGICFIWITIALLKKNINLYWKIIWLYFWRFKNMSFFLTIARQGSKDTLGSFWVEHQDWTLAYKQGKSYHGGWLRVRSRRE